MLLKKLTLKDFRNYEHVELDTNNSVNLFIGPNAQGKTNLLESIYVLALTKSHRTHHDKELIRWNQKEAFIQCELDKKYGSYKLDLALSLQGKKAKINGLEQKKLSQYVGTMNVVIFAPEDMEIVKGAPGIRRRFMDMEIGQIYPGYLHDLSQFQKILMQRNNFLKRSQTLPYDSALLDVWNEQFIQYSVKIMKKRQNFIIKLQNWAELIHSSITSHNEKLYVQYAPSFGFSEYIDDEIVLYERCMIKLKEMKDQEMRRGMSLVGPHRDDLLFYINDKQVQNFGSQGQQRTTALSIKLAEIQLVYEEVGEYPILLLDDVLSELDRTRQTQLIETFQDKVQTFITATDVDYYHADRYRNAVAFHINEGQFKTGPVK